MFWPKLTYRWEGQNLLLRMSLDNLIQYFYVSLDVPTRDFFYFVRADFTF